MWTPREIRRLIVLIAGIGFMIVGIVLIVKQIQATGLIDIGSEAFKGRIQSGSAGLFVCFFAFWLVFVAVSGKEGSTGETRVERNPELPGAKKSAFSLSTRHKRWLLGVVLIWVFELIFVVWALVSSSKIGTQNAAGPIALSVLWFLCLVLPVTISFFVSWANSRSTE